MADTYMPSNPVQEQIDTLNSKTVPTAITISVDANSSGKISIDSNNCYQIGKLVIVNIRFTVTSEIPSGVMLINGLPKANVTTALGYSFGACASNREDIPMGLCLHHDNVYTAICSGAKAVPAQTYAISASYVAL